MATVTVNISFQETLLRDIDRIAKKESRSRSECIREAARLYIQRRERWDRLFAAGRDIARRKGLKPDDVSQQISAHRRKKQSGS